MPAAEPPLGTTSGITSGVLLWLHVRALMGLLQTAYEYVGVVSVLRPAIPSS
jgi:hypothetical protein